MSDPVGTTSGFSSGHQITIFDLDQQPHNQQDVDLLYKLYQQKRIDSQSASLPC